ncbi:MAG: hypothetical protein ABI091_12995, partial [Ferruginibacter sp.]
MRGGNTLENIKTADENLKSMEQLKLPKPPLQPVGQIVNGLETKPNDFNATNNSNNPSQSMGYSVNGLSNNDILNNIKTANNNLKLMPSNSSPKEPLQIPGQIV